MVQIVGNATYEIEEAGAARLLRLALPDTLDAMEFDQLNEALLGLIATFLRQRCRLVIDTGEAEIPVPTRMAPFRLDAAVRSIASGPVAIDTGGGAA